MSDLTAIDILINPDEATIAARPRVSTRGCARACRTGSRSTPPTSRTSPRCSATCAPPTSTTSTPPSSRRSPHTDVAALSYQAVAIRHADWGVPGQGLAVLVLQPSPQVLDFQAALLAAVTPFTESGGTAAAFVTDPGESRSARARWTGSTGYVPDQIGAGIHRPHHRRFRHPGRPQRHRGRALRRLPRPPGQRRRLPPRQQRHRPHSSSRRGRWRPSSRPGRPTLLRRPARRTGGQRHRGPEPDTPKGWLLSTRSIRCAPKSRCCSAW